MQCSEVERYKIQITNLNQRISDLEMENSDLIKVKGEDHSDSQIAQLQQSLDFQKNLNKCQALTIEKLENRILAMESDKNNELKTEQAEGLEKAQLQRKITSLENQLRFQINQNEETKKEIEKLDIEVSQMADNCSNREQILQKKLEDQGEMLRKERVQIAALKSDVMQRDNVIERIKSELKNE